MKHPNIFPAWTVGPETFMILDLLFIIKAYYEEPRRSGRHEEFLIKPSDYPISGCTVNQYGFFSEKPEFQIFSLKKFIDDYPKIRAKISVYQSFPYGSFWNCL